MSPAFIGRPVAAACLTLAAWALIAAVAWTVEQAMNEGGQS